MTHLHTNPHVVPVTTPSGVLALPRQVADVLLEQGVISGSIASGLHAADAATIKAALATSHCCDFCGMPGAHDHFDAPDFELPHGSGLSTGGWAACEPCASFVRADQRSALLARAIERLAFGKFTKPAIAEIHARFWKAMSDKAAAAGAVSAFAEFVEVGLLRPENASDDRRRLWSARDNRIMGVARLLGITQQQAEALAFGKPDHETLVKAKKVTDRLVGPGGDRHCPAWEAAIAALLSDGEGRKPLPAVVPHWQAALEAKFDAMRSATRLASQAVPAHLYSPKETDLRDPAAVGRIVREAALAKDIFQEHNRADASALSHAETYSFNGETVAAITLAAKSIPHETPLSAIDTPGSGRSGWFWFGGTPLDVHVSNEAPGTLALLWYWASVNGVTELCFSAYSRDTDGTLRAGAFWRWALTHTFRDLVLQVQRAYDDGTVLVANDNPFTRDESVRATAELTLFFVAACTWMKQRILVSEPQHVERHLRKRYVREHRLANPPEVQVIALRKSVREQHGAETPRSEGGTTREYDFRWVVSGHPRLQKCGPGRKDVKLIWIDPYLKGPDDKPLRTRRRVYAVVR